MPLLFFGLAFALGFCFGLAGVLGCGASYLAEALALLGGAFAGGIMQGGNCAPKP